MTKSGNLYIVSAPSGAGKTSLLKALTATIENISTAISTTTRGIRSGEVDGVDYHFVSIEKFTLMIEQGDFIEHAEVFGNYYGTSKSHLIDALQQGQDMVVEIDWQGAQQVRNQLAEAISIFILPPSKNELEKRLTGRGQDDPKVIKKRMDAAIKEISHYSEYDFIVVNDEFNVALADLENIIKANRLLKTRQVENHSILIDDLL